MYLALYRKWRPRVFSEVISQEHITKTLQNQVRTGKLAHAYLFTGSRGTGKTTCSKILAKAANCLHPVDGNPCLECSVCKGIDDGSILDVVEMDAASNNSVDDVRDLRDEAGYAPTVCKYRVYIIDEVHMLSSSAFNALLKIMEEPPPHVLFILATTEVHKVPQTIVSRCQQYDFRRIRPADSAKRMLEISEQEEFTLEPDAAALIARLADGGMRDALSLLDQCAAFSDHIDEKTVADTAGIAGSDHLFALSDAILRKDAASAILRVGELYDNAKGIDRLVSELIGHFRSVMLCKSVTDPKNLVVCLPEEMEKFMELARAMSLSRILEILSAFQQCLDALSRSSNKKVELEMTLIRLCSSEETAAVRSDPAAGKAGAGGEGGSGTGGSKAGTGSTRSGKGTGSQGADGSSCRRRQHPPHGAVGGTIIRAFPQRTGAFCHAGRVEGFYQRRAGTHRIPEPDAQEPASHRQHRRKAGGSGRGDVGAAVSAAHHQTGKSSGFRAERICS